MRKPWLYALLFLLCPLLVAMGGAPGDTPPDKIPSTVKKFAAVFVDQSDVATECTEVSIDGAVFLEGKKGEGAFTVSFDNIREIRFRRQGDRLIGAARLTDGQTVEPTVKKDKRAYGRTGYGTFQIRLDELKKMTFR